MTTIPLKQIHVKQLSRRITTSDLLMILYYYIPDVDYFNLLSITNIWFINQTFAILRIHQKDYILLVTNIKYGSCIKEDAGRKLQEILGKIVKERGKKGQLSVI